MREVSQEGVTCVYCRRLRSGAPKGILLHARPLAAYHGTIRNPVANARTSRPTRPTSRSEFCGACHAYSNQNGVTISDTYGEWKRSRYAKQGVTCQTCHMPGGRAELQRRARAPRVRITRSTRPSSRLAPERGHPDPDRVARVPGRDSLRIYATATNTGWGHSLPTGNDQNLALIRSACSARRQDRLGERPLHRVERVGLRTDPRGRAGNWPADTWNAVNDPERSSHQAGGSARVRFDVPVSGTTGPFEVQAQLLSTAARSP